MGVYTEMAVKHAADTAPFTEADSFQLALDMQRADHAMFEALIELDFGEIYQEMGIMLVTEADEAEGKKFSINAIKQKVKDIIDKFITGVKKFIKLVAVKFDQLFQRDQALYKKLAGDFDKNFNNTNMTGFLAPDYTKIEKGIGDNTFVTILSNFNDFKKALDGADSVESINNAKKSYSDKMTALKDQIKNMSVDGYFIKDSVNKPLKDAVDDPNKVKEYMQKGCKNSVRDLEKYGEKVISSVDTIKKSVDSADSKKDDVSKAYLTAISNGVSIAHTVNNTFITFQTSVMRKAYAETRKIFIAAARGAKAKENNQTSDNNQTVNASYVEDLCTMSDFFVEEALTF